MSDPNEDPIQRSVSVPGCGSGACSTSVSLTSGDGLVEGVSYIVEVMAVNRYGESAVSGNSEPFRIGGGGEGGGSTGVCVCVCVCVCARMSCVCV